MSLVAAAFAEVAGASLPMATGMELPEVGAGDALVDLVAAVVRKRRGASHAGAPPAAGTHAHWDAGFFGLDRVGVFAAAAPAAQDAVLERCGRGLLTEAFYIEKAGVAFAAKMILLAPTIDERKLYAMFAADEATHLHGIGAFVDAPEDAPRSNPFLALLSELIEDGERDSLQMVIQIVLEGWGLAHYRSLRDGCQDESLRGLFTAILADEAAHHGSGVLLIGERRLGAASRERVLATMTRFLAMVQAGPQAVAGAVEAELGPLSTAARIRLFDELDAERHSAARLAQLRDLMCKTPGGAELAARLERSDCFRPKATKEL